MSKVKFELADDFQGELGAPLEDVAQEAVDATATVYTNDASIDVEQHLSVELSSRGIKAVKAEWIAEVGGGIRSGHHVSVGEPDGSVKEQHPE